MLRIGIAMIDVAQLTGRDLERAVVYRTGPLYEPEQGVIKGWNVETKTVFVDYGDSCGRAKATYACDLTFMNE